MVEKRVGILFQGILELHVFDYACRQSTISKILLIKNEGKKGRKDKPERNRERELIAIRQKLKSEREPRNKKEKILKYFVH